MNNQRENTHHEPFFGEKHGSELSAESSAASELSEAEFLSGIPSYKNPKEVQTSEPVTHTLDEPPQPVSVDRAPFENSPHSEFHDYPNDVTQTAPEDPSISTVSHEATTLSPEPEATTDKNDKQPDDDRPVVIVKPSIRGCWPDLLSGVTVVILLFLLAGPVVQGYAEIFSSATVEQISAFNDTVNFYGFWAVIGTVIFVWLRTLYVQHNEKIFLGQTYVELHKGIIARDRTRINLDHIRSVDTKQGLIDRLLNIGSLHLSTAGTSETEVTVTKIFDPLKVRDAIKGQQNEMMQQRHQSSQD